MSWSVNAIGSAKAVAQKAAQDLDAFHTAEPEETIKNKAKELIVAACEGLGDSGIMVTGSGSQAMNYQTGEVTTVYFDLKIQSIQLVVE